MSVGLLVCVALVAGFVIGDGLGNAALKQGARREAELRRLIAQQAEAVRAPEPPPAPEPVQDVAPAVVPASGPVTDPAPMMALMEELKSSVTEAARLSNELARVWRESDAFRRSMDMTLASARTELEAARVELRQRSARIELLEGQMGALNQQIRDLSERLGRQDLRVAEAERQLSTARGDRSALQRNLDILLAERTEIASRLKDKKIQSSALRRSRDSEAAARDSILSRGMFGVLGLGKGGEKQGASAPPAVQPSVAARRVTATSVDVEIGPAESPRARSQRSPASSHARPRGATNAPPAPAP